MQILIAWLGRGISFVLFYGPASLRRYIANFLTFLWFDLFRIRRQVVLENISIAFPEMSHKDKVKLGRKSLRHMALNLVEYCYLPWLTKENFHQYMIFENAALLESALAKGKGVLLMTLHMGHGDLACGSLSLHGYPMIMVSKVFKLKWLNDLWFGMRERLGTRFIAPRDSSFALLRGLKSGAAVVIPLDQFTGPPIGVRTTFFGKETGTAAGLAVMSERSGAPVLSVYCYRDAKGRHVIRFVREMPVPKGRDPEAVAKVTQTFNDELEHFVRLHPDQWMWIHRRWKRFVVT
ncbi:MAG: lysophospholipid acyltransferase family protein [Bdellovibrionales bacterium]